MSNYFIRTAASVSAAAMLAFGAAQPAVVRADPMSDQKKAYEILGRKPTPAPMMCSLLSKTDVERVLGKPVHDGEPGGNDPGCSYRALDGSKAGVLVTRRPRDEFFGATDVPHYHALSGFGDKAFTSLEYVVGYDAEAANAKGVTNVLVAGSKTPDMAVALLRIAMSR